MAFGVLMMLATPVTRAENARIEGRILAAKVQGAVSAISRVNQSTRSLQNGDAVNQNDVVTTGRDSSVILVFSNGATVNLGAETSLVIEEFLQDPFADDLAMNKAKAEPTTSVTKLHLARGELLGSVKHLDREHGSSFTISTAVGAAGIRGTVFRMLLRVDSRGKATFSLSTSEGEVAFQKADGSTVAVSAGRELSFQFKATVNPATGEVVPLATQSNSTKSSSSSSTTASTQSSTTNANSATTGATSTTGAASTTDNASTTTNAPAADNPSGSATPPTKVDATSGSAANAGTSGNSDGNATSNNADAANTTGGTSTSSGATANGSGQSGSGDTSSGAGNTTANGSPTETPRTSSTVSNPSDPAAPANTGTSPTNSNSSPGSVAEELPGSSATVGPITSDTVQRINTLEQEIIVTTTDVTITAPVAPDAQTGAPPEETPHTPTDLPPVSPY